MSYGVTYYISAVVGDNDGNSGVNLNDPCCSSSGTPVVFHPDLFEATLSSAPDTVCAGALVTLTASGGGAYSWSNGLGTNPTVIAIPVSTTTYAVTVTATNGCTDTASATIEVDSLLPLAAINPIGSVSICQGNSVILMASPASSYSWSNGATTQKHYCFIYWRFYRNGDRGKRMFRSFINNFGRGHPFAND
ncbi:MAG: hypothetical protein IPN76_14005 [Saprospiraceae bacterium]|nr:hypothetical protein [Saprospiraceae bacterium]